MSSRIDELIGSEVERSFADEPPLRDPREYAVRGRGVRRRRRIAGAGVGVTAAAILTLLVTSGTQPTTGSDRGIEPAGPVPGGVIPVRGTEPLPVDPRQAELCTTGHLGGCDGAVSWDDIHFDETGQLVRGYAYVKVTGYYEDVLPDAYTSSAAVELTVHGRTVWALLNRVGTESSGLETSAPDPDRTFDEWVAASTRRGGGWFSYRPDPDGPGEGSTPR